MIWNFGLKGIDDSLFSRLYLSSRQSRLMHLIQTQQSLLTQLQLLCRLFNTFLVTTKQHLSFHSSSMTTYSPLSNSTSLWNHHPYTNEPTRRHHSLQWRQFHHFMARISTHRDCLECIEISIEGCGGHTYLKEMYD